MELDDKEVLHHYLRSAREALLWKLDGLSEYDVRRPLTSSGTNLLGLVKHLAMVELGYFGDVFDRPSGEELPWDGRELEPNEDMYATADESREAILGLYQRATAHADETIDALGLDAVGHVPWWNGGPDRITLHMIMVHMIAETNRHAGHADIVRELIDGAVGLRQSASNVPDADDGWWADYVERVETEASRAAGRADS